MKKIIAVLLCLVLVVSLAACAGEDEARKAGFEEGRKAGYDEGYAAGKDDGYKTGKEDGIKEGKASVSSSRKYAKFSGSFTASVMKLTEDGYALPGNTVAVVHFFQDGPFLLRFYEDITGKLIEGKAYVFEFETFEVLIPDDEQYPDIKNYATSIKVTGYRAAKDDEMGMQSRMPEVEITER